MYLQTKNIKKYNVNVKLHFYEEKTNFFSTYLMVIFFQW